MFPATSTATFRSVAWTWASSSPIWRPSASRSASVGKKLTGVQLGYESRCAAPHAFDVMLGSQLGVGAYRALVEENLDGHMVSVAVSSTSYVPFGELVDPER